MNSRTATIARAILPYVILVPLLVRGLFAYAQNHHNPFGILSLLACGFLLVGFGFRIVGYRQRKRAP